MTTTLLHGGNLLEINHEGQSIVLDRDEVLKLREELAGAAWSMPVGSMTPSSESTVGGPDPLKDAVFPT